MSPWGLMATPFEPYWDIFGHIRTIFEPYSNHIRTYSDHIRSKFARSESGIMFFFGAILTWPCQNTIFPSFSTYFGPKFQLNVVLGSKFARSESGIMFLFRSILTWPCQNMIFPTFSTYFGSKFHLNLVLGSKFARSESGIMFFQIHFDMALSKHDFSDMFDLLWTQIPTKCGLGV